MLTELNLAPAGQDWPTIGQRITSHLPLKVRDLKAKATDTGVFGRNTKLPETMSLERRQGTTSPSPCADSRRPTSMAVKGINVEAAASPEVALARFADFVAAKELPWSSKKVLIGTADRFLHWVLGQVPQGCDIASMLTDQALWRTRESFLIADCPDRDVRHDLRVQVNLVITFLTADPAQQ